MTEEKKTRQPAEVAKVTMTDGREVDFAGKRKMLKEIMKLGVDGIALRFDFRNGETRTYDLNPALTLQFAAHGGLQKYGDETAGLEDVDDMVEATDEIHGRLEKGEWSVQREANGLSGVSVLMKALIELTGKTKDQVREFLSPLSQAEKNALRASPQLKPIVDRIEAEKAAKGGQIDVGSLLGKLAA